MCNLTLDGLTPTSERATSYVAPCVVYAKQPTCAWLDADELGFDFARDSVVVVKSANLHVVPVSCSSTAQTPSLCTSS